MPVPAAISADPAGVLVAFGAGILSFVSPCVLPLVPGYVSMVSGLSAAELEAGGDGATPSAALRPVLRGIGLFVAGFTVVFVALGATASSIGRLLSAHEVALAQVSGAVIIVARGGHAARPRSRPGCGPTRASARSAS